MTLFPAHSLSELIVARDESARIGTLQAEHIVDVGISWVIYRSGTDTVFLEFDPDDGEV